MSKVWLSEKALPRLSVQMLSHHSHIHVGEAGKLHNSLWERCKRGSRGASCAPTQVKTLFAGSSAAYSPLDLGAGCKSNCSVKTEDMCLPCQAFPVQRNRSRPSVNSTRTRGQIPQASLGLLTPAVSLAQLDVRSALNENTGVACYDVLQGDEYHPLDVRPTAGAHPRVLREKLQQPRKYPWGRSASQQSGLLCCHHLHRA